MVVVLVWAIIKLLVFACIPFLRSVHAYMDFLLVILNYFVIFFLILFSYLFLWLKNCEMNLSSFTHVNVECYKLIEIGNWLMHHSDWMTLVAKGHTLTLSAHAIGPTIICREVNHGWFFLPFERCPLHEGGQEPDKHFAAKN